MAAQHSGVEGERRVLEPRGVVVAHEGTRGQDGAAALSHRLLQHESVLLVEFGSLAELAPVGEANLGH